MLQVEVGPGDVGSGVVQVATEGQVWALWLGVVLSPEVVEPVQDE